MRARTCRDAVSARTRWAENLPVLAKLLTFSVLVEFVILRGVNRMTHLFPGWMKGTFTTVILFTGNWAYDLAFIASALVGLFVAYLLFPREKVLALLIFIWFIALMGARFIWPEYGSLVLARSLMAALLIIFLMLRKIHRLILARNGGGEGEATLTGRYSKWRGKGVYPFFLLVLLAFLSSIYLHAGNSLSNLGWSLPRRAGVYGLGEVFAVAAAYLTPLAFWVGPRARDLVPPTLAAVVLSLFFFFRPDILPLMTMWSLGFQLYLPLPVYLGAIWCFVFALVLLFRDRLHGRYLIPGLLLVGLAGRMLNDLYLLQMALAGALFLTLAPDLAAASPENANGCPTVERKRERGGVFHDQHRWIGGT